MSRCEMFWSKQSGWLLKSPGAKRMGPKSLGAKRPGLKWPDAKHPGPKRSGAKHSSPKSSGAKGPGPSGCEMSKSKMSGSKKFGCKMSRCETSGSVHFMIVKLPASPLWLWHSLGPLHDCVTSWGLLMIVILPVPLYDCDTSCASLWLWYFVWLFMIVILCVPLYDCNTSWAFMIVAHFMILVAPLWLWHSLRPLYEHDILLLSFKFDWWLINWFERIGVTWHRWSNMLLLKWSGKKSQLPSLWPWPSGHGWRGWYWEKV